jgi:hypothetical protein
MPASAPLLGFLWIQGFQCHLSCPVKKSVTRAHLQVVGAEKQKWNKECILRVDYFRWSAPLLSHGPSQSLRRGKVKPKTLAL